MRQNDTGRFFRPPYLLYDASPIRHRRAEPRPAVAERERKPLHDKGLGQPKVRRPPAASLYFYLLTEEFLP